MFLASASEQPRHSEYIPHAHILYSSRVLVNEYQQEKSQAEKLSVSPHVRSTGGVSVTYTQFKDDNMYAEGSNACLPFLPVLIHVQLWLRMVCKKEENNA